MTKIFISYRREDSQHQTDRLHGLMKHYFRKPKADVFIDVDNIPPGVDFVKHLDQIIARCQILFAVIGDEWIDVRDRKSGARRLDDPSDFVRAEIAAALSRGIPVVPVLLDDTPLPQPHQLPEDLRELSTRNGVVLRRLSFEGDVDRLMRGLGFKKIKKTGILPAVGIVAALSFAGVAVIQQDIVGQFLSDNEPVSDEPAFNPVRTSSSEDNAQTSENSDSFELEQVAPVRMMDEEPLRGRVRDPSKILPTVQRDCIDWPSEDAWDRGGLIQDPRVGFPRYPGWQNRNSGNLHPVGEVVAKLAHCDGFDIYLLNYEGDYLPVRTEAVDLLINSVRRTIVD